MRKKRKRKRSAQKAVAKNLIASSGGQAGHKGTTLNQVENPDQIVEHTPDQCQECSGDTIEVRYSGVFGQTGI